jgi:hypothetical protein
MAPLKNYLATASTFLVYMSRCHRKISATNTVLEILKTYHYGYDNKRALIQMHKNYIISFRL